MKYILPISYRFQEIKQQRMKVPDVLCNKYTPGLVHSAIYSGFLNIHEDYHGLLLLILQWSFFPPEFTCLHEIQLHPGQNSRAPIWCTSAEWNTWIECTTYNTINTETEHQTKQLQVRLGSPILVALQLGTSVKISLVQLFQTTFYNWNTRESQMKTLKVR